MGPAWQEVQSQGPGDRHLPPKPAPLTRTIHVPAKEVVDEYVKVVGVENVAGTGIRVLDCALSVNEVKGLPAIPKDVCSVRERLQKLQQENVEPLRYLLRVKRQAGPVALSKGVFSNFALGLYQWLSPAPKGLILQLSAETSTALFAMMQRAQGPQRQYVSVYHVPDAVREKEALNDRTAISCLRCGVPRTRGWFSYPCRMIRKKNLCKLRRGRAMATTRPSRGTWSSKSLALFC